MERHYTEQELLAGDGGENEVVRIAGEDNGHVTALDWAPMRSIVAWSNMKVVEKLEGLVKRLDGESRKVSQQGGE